MLRVLTVLVLLAGLTSQPAPSSAAQRDDGPPDTTAPQLDLNPCFDGETTCRRVLAQVWGDLEAGDDLAVLGARIGDQVVAEKVYDDGTGFEPEGYFNPYGNDVLVPVDYALSVEVPRGTSDITFYARDLEGNTNELTTTVLGPRPPGRVSHVQAVRMSQGVFLGWRAANAHGACCTRYDVTTPGRHDRSCYTAPPSGCVGVIYRHLSRGWHRFTVRATTVGGTGPARSVRRFVKRPASPHSP